MRVARVVCLHTFICLTAALAPRSDASEYTSTVGNTTVFDSVSTKGNRRAMPFTMPEAGTIGSVSIYHGAGSGSMLLGVYGGSGTPGPRLALTAETPVSGVAGWQTVPLVTPIAVAQGTQIWLAWVFQTNPGIRYRDGSPGRAQSSSGWSGGMPDPFGTATFDNNIYSIYASYSPGPPEPPPETAIVGNTTVFPLVSTAANRRAMPFTMPENGTIESVSIYHEAGSGSMLLGVYGGSGTPGPRLAVTAETPVSGAAGWQTVPLVTPIAVAQGTQIWLAWVFQSNPGIRYRDGSPGRAQSSSSWPSRMPDPFGTATIGNNIYSIYASYSPAPPTQTAIVGNTAVFPLVSTKANRRAMPFTMPEAGTLESVSIYHEAGSGLMILGVYEGQTAPGSRLGVTAATTVNGTTGWQTVALAQPVTVPAGTRIWLAWVFEQAPRLHYQAGSPGRAESTGTWSGGMPDPFGACTFAANVYSIYATYSRPPADAPEITVWYGASQRFGDLGTPQRWVNILGTVGDPTVTLSFSLNGGAARPLSVGPTPRRLAEAGDFNCEIAVEDMLEGANEVVVKATAVSGAISTARVDVAFSRQNIWPLPYAIPDWGAVQDIQDVCQVTDGLWKLEPAGLRTVQIWYDRLVAIGDRTWTNYEVLVPVTVHSIDHARGDPSPSKGPAVGILTLWPGHTFDPNNPTAQPTENYIPFGGIGLYWWHPDGTNAAEIYVNPGKILARDVTQTITMGHTYWFRFRTEVSGGIPRYRLNVWENGTTEPAGWELEAPGKLGDPVTGSFLLLAHHVDATFGPLTVTPVTPQ